MAHESLVADLATQHAVPLDSQLLISPASLLGMPEPQGDCAVYSTLVACLLIAANVPCWFRVTANDAEQPEVWGHVYVVALANRQKVVLDTSHGKFFGWEVRTKYRQMDFRI